MVFIGGPRQVGKTTLSLQFLKPSKPSNPNYMNWDNLEDKSKILKNQLPLSAPILVLDEIHKYRLWRNLLKGLYDKFHSDTKFIVTGSARLDYYRRGGDSLLGRYRYFRLHPFSLPEYSKNLSQKDLDTLLKFGGFPEPLFEQDEDNHRIWIRDRMAKVILEDLRDLENVKEVSLVLLLAETLPSKVGSPLSLKSMEEDLQVSMPTIKRWLQLLEWMYYCYQIRPYGSPKIRAVKKLQKVYLWDWSQVEDKGARFENLVAGHLLKYCHFIEDTKGYTMELCYLRDTDGREIDFVVLQNKKPIFAVECKSGDKDISKHIGYFRDRTAIPAFYQVHNGSASWGTPEQGCVLPFREFCKMIPLV
ncbi:MAG: ATP-binding protein [Leptospira sp.]|nr:ATP-binding protein [Leptospira sp.]